MRQDQASLSSVEPAGGRSDMGYSVLRSPGRVRLSLGGGTLTTNYDDQVTKPQFMTGLDACPKKPVI